MKTPCNGCTRRPFLCHGFCEEYQAWKKEREEINARRSAENEMTGYDIGDMRRIRGKKK